MTRNVCEALKDGEEERVEYSDDPLPEITSGAGMENKNKIK